MGLRKRIREKYSLFIILVDTNSFFCFNLFILAFFMKLFSFLFPNFDTHDSSQPTSHWFQQRLSAFLAIIFGLWFLISIQSMPGLEYTSVRNWLSSFYNALILFFLIIVISYHSSLGIKVIIEDYIHHSLIKNLAIICNSFFHFICAVFSSLIVLKIFLEF